MILCLCDDHLRWSKAVARRALSHAPRDAWTTSRGNGNPKIPPWDRGESANYADVLLQLSGTILQHENMDFKIGTSQTSHTHAIKLWGSKAKKKLSGEDATGWLATSQLQNRYMMIPTWWMMAWKLGACCYFIWWLTSLEMMQVTETYDVTRNLKNTIGQSLTSWSHLLNTPAAADQGRRTKPSAVTLLSRGRL